MSECIPLELLHVSETARIVDIDAAPEVATRLSEMGLHLGVLVRMIQPGSPCILGIGHQRLSFRAEEMATILVEVVAGG